LPIHGRLDEQNRGLEPDDSGSLFVSP
jgi:hypothetical protein